MTAAGADLLLDTHVRLWFDADPERLPAEVAALVRDRSRRVYVSAMSVWELAVKNRSGRLPEADALLGAYSETLGAYGFTELPFTSVHARKDLVLNDAHRDPFDQALVAQALSEGLQLVSKDPVVAAFSGVTVVWA